MSVWQVLVWVLPVAWVLLMFLVIWVCKHQPPRKASDEIKGVVQGLEDGTLVRDDGFDDALKELVKR